MDWSEVGCVVLCGGTSRRFDGGDKTAATFRRTTVLDHLLGELPVAGPIVCVGDRRPTTREVQWTRESPPGGGPVAAIAAGLQRVSTPLVAVIAGDMPYAARGLAALASALEEHPSAAGALAESADGRHQLLLGLHRTASLRAILPADPDGVPVRRVLTASSLLCIPVDDLAVADIDTREHLRHLESVDDRH